MRGKNQQYGVTVINNIRDRDQQHEITGIKNMRGQGSVARLDINQEHFKICMNCKFFLH